MRVKKVTMYQVYSEKVGNVLKDFLQTENPKIADSHYKKLMETKGVAVCRKKIVEKTLSDILHPYRE